MIGYSMITRDFISIESRLYLLQILYWNLFPDQVETSLGRATCTLHLILGPDQPGMKQMYHHKSVNLQINMLVRGLMGQTNRRPSVWCSKYFFSYFLIDLGHSKLFTFNFIKKYENKLKLFLQRIMQDFMKEMILGTSDAWSTIHLSHRPGKAAYYIEDWRISYEKG